MNSALKRFTNSYTGYVAIISSLITSGYWILGNVFNPYSINVVGALYEMLWIFMIPLLFFIPIASIIGVIVNKLENSYFYLISIILNIGTFIWLNLYL